MFNTCVFPSNISAPCAFKIMVMITTSFRCMHCASDNFHIKHRNGASCTQKHTSIIRYESLLLLRMAVPAPLNDLVEKRFGTVFFKLSVPFSLSLSLCLGNGRGCRQISF